MGALKGMSPEKEEGRGVEWGLGRGLGGSADLLGFGGARENPRVR